MPPTLSTFLKPLQSLCAAEGSEESLRMAMRRQALLQCGRRRALLLCSSYNTAHPKQARLITSSSPSSYLGYCFLQFLSKPKYHFSFRFFNTKSSILNRFEENSIKDETLEEEAAYEWEEEEDEAEPEIGDGGDGGGVVLGSVSWGEQALRLAQEVLLPFGDDMELFAFKISPRGYIYVRLDKLSNRYGCPSMDEIENFSCLYKKRLDEVGESGDIPSDLALEVSSPGAERLLKVPDDLDRFKEMPMCVCYAEGDDGPSPTEKDGVFLLESLETALEQCVWKLANVRENRDLLGKGRPLSRKQKDWRLRLPFGSLKRVSLYIDNE